MFSDIVFFLYNSVIVFLLATAKTNDTLETTTNFTVQKRGQTVQRDITEKTNKNEHTVSIQQFLF
jgi:hypothetical protein